MMRAPWQDAFGLFKQVYMSQTIDARSARPTPSDMSFFARHMLGAGLDCLSAPGIIEQAIFCCKDRGFIGATVWSAQGVVMMEKKRNRCFVISPIGEAGTTIRRDADMVLNAIIKPALEDFEVIRADGMATADMINDKIMEAIFNSELAIADLTGHNPNVYYELGLRHMAEKPVIHIAANGTKLPFDNIGMTTVFYDVADWHSQQAAKASIAAMANACLAARKVSNPVTQARGSINLAHSADSRDVMIAGMHDRLAAIEAALRSEPQLRTSRRLREIMRDNATQMPASSHWATARGLLDSVESYVSNDELIEAIARKIP